MSINNVFDSKSTLCYAIRRTGQYHALCRCKGFESSRDTLEVAVYTIHLAEQCVINMDYCLPINTLHEIIIGIMPFHK